MIQYLATTHISCLSMLCLLLQSTRIRAWPLLLLIGATCSAYAETQVDPTDTTSVTRDIATSVPTTRGFSWPASTHISYLITGEYRGAVHGTANLDWLNLGTQYQVQFEILLGPSTAPILRRTSASKGVIGMRGLTPRRYDNETRIAFAAPRRQFINFYGMGVESSTGSWQESPLVGVQDAASQHMQLAYVLTTVLNKPSVGRVLVMPLALPNKQIQGTFDVLGVEQLDTALGVLPAIHIKNRALSRRSDEATATEWWFAPSLGYLPVRMRIWRDEQSYVDMLISGPPQGIVEVPDAVASTASIGASVPDAAQVSNAQQEPPQTDTYAGKVSRTIKNNLVFKTPIDGNPETEVAITLEPDGRITNIVLVRSSGIIDWDQAVVAAVKRTDRIPLDNEGKVPPVLNISFRPNSNP